MIEEIENILDVQFRDEVVVDYINLEYRPDEKRFRKEGDTLHLNIATLNDTERGEVVELAPTQFDETGRVLRHEEEIDTGAMVSGYSDKLDEILDYFGGILSDTYCTILDKSLNLRALLQNKELSKDEIRERKGQIARWHGSDAVYLSSLTTAGYFDPNGGLRDLFVDMGLNPEYSRHQFQQTLSEYVEKELICEFVESGESISEATQNVRGGLRRYQREEPIQDWYDIRGIGNQCAEIIDGVMNSLESDYITIDYDRWTDGADLWVRIYPRSLPPIPP